MPSECVVGSSSSRARRRARASAGAASCEPRRARRQVGGPERGRRAVGVAELGDARRRRPRRSTSRRRRRSVGARPALAQPAPPPRGTRAPGSPPVGRACVGLVQCVWCPSGPRAAASRARSSQRPLVLAALVGRPHAAPRSGSRPAAPPGARRSAARRGRRAAARRGRTRLRTFATAAHVRDLRTRRHVRGAPTPPPSSAMNAAIVHRGPDDGARRRLRPLRARPPAPARASTSRPATSRSRTRRGDVVAVFNGELYNFRELRAELAARPRRSAAPATRRSSRTSTRSTALDFVERLEGMFALALWDAARERLVLARDRLGKKPLLWTRLADGSLAFASELKALLQLPGLARRARPRRARRLPGAPVRPRAGDGARGDPASCRRATCSSPRAGGDARRALLAAEPSQPSRVATRRVARARPRRGDRGGPAAARRGRPARRAPLRRHRLQRSSSR